MTHEVRSLENQASVGVSVATVCHIAGYLSIAASIFVWFFAQGDGSAEALAHAERFGLFIGLWAPTFFILSIKYDDKR